MEIILVGNGKMAQAIREYCNKISQVCRPWESGFTFPEEVDRSSVVVIHVGSGRQLPEVIEFCTEHQVALIQASDNMGAHVTSKPNCVIFNAPNFVLPVHQFTNLLGTFTDQMALVEVEPKEILESHPKGQRSWPAHTVQIARCVGLPLTAIVSERDPESQLARGIPPEHLICHSYHWIAFTGQGTRIVLTIEVDGLEPYAMGAVRIARLSRMMPWPHGIHTTQELLENCGKE